MQMHDIFPAVDTTWYLIAILAAGLLIVLPLCYLLWRWLKRKKRKNRHYYLDILRRYDPNDAKTVANRFCYYGKYLVHTAEQKEYFHTLCEKLTPYKYTKKSRRLDETIIQEMESFLKHTGAKKDV